MTHIHIIRTYANLILEVLVVLVQCVVLVNILHIRSCLVRRVVALRSRLVIWRVSLWHVYSFIAVQDRCLTLVVVTTAEVVVVVVCGVSQNTVECSSIRYLRPRRIQEVLVVAECLLFLVAESVISHVLQSA